MRPIDNAMQNQRADKGVVRSLWIDRAAEYQLQFPLDTEPLYLTLPGSDGFDIGLFVTEKLISLTETGALAASSVNKVVAVERDNQAVFHLQRKFPGLTILQQDIAHVLKGDSPTQFPQGEHLKYCRARIVNLDFQQSLTMNRDEAGKITEPLFVLIEKLAIVHEKPVRNWTLCLTLNATLALDNDVVSMMCSFLQENFKRSDEFKNKSRLLMGDEDFTMIEANNTAGVAGFDKVNQQKLLMMYVPKRVAFLGHARGWLVTTRRNLRYGAPPESAPMVTWVMDFVQDSRRASSPNELYLESLTKVLAHAGHVAPNGDLLDIVS